MNEWARLVDKYAGELKKYDLVCAYCGQHLSDHTVNTQCADNANDFDGCYFTDEEPYNTQRGRHWFGRPSLRGLEHNKSMNRSMTRGSFNQASQRCDEFIVTN